MLELVYRMVSKTIGSDPMSVQLRPAARRQKLVRGAQDSPNYSASRKVRGRQNRVRVFARLNFAKQILADDSLPAGRQVSRGTYIYFSVRRITLAPSEGKILARKIDFILPFFEKFTASEHARVTLKLLFSSSFLSVRKVK